MKCYFNILLEFDKTIVNETIENTVRNSQKGYVCAIESNNLTIANKNEEFRKIINNALVNICDGSNITWFLSKIHKQPYKSYVGNDIFLHFIAQKKYRHYFLGNTPDILHNLRENLFKIDPQISQMQFIGLPFRGVEKFDYPSIADSINKDKPDLIWVSLGAPKQEIFMSMLCPYIQKGVLFGVGAAFNFNAKVGPVKRAPKWMRNLRMEWVYRAFEEPQKNIPRYWGFLKLLPKLLINEIHNREK
ncbi:WecB/TagA/CpsF family glycosyltransferase [Parabacteroides sp. OttesenSCG-928-G07]|nr:WecB/TagA/CpsF family glycosyltransferase [Parabacteroides sp. OttesenSCG-928-G07]